MGFVLADTHDWLSPPSTSSSSASAPFEITPLQTFARLREAVNDRTADFFMWEHFTSKRYYDNGEIKRIGEIYTPWPSWHIVARSEVIGDERTEEMLEMLNLGIRYFEEHQEEAVEYISTELDYSAQDAREWLKTVKFAEDVRGVRRSVVQETVTVLKKQGFWCRRSGWRVWLGFGGGSDKSMWQKRTGVHWPYTLKFSPHSRLRTFGSIRQQLCLLHSSRWQFCETKLCGFQ